MAELAVHVGSGSAPSTGEPDSAWTSVRKLPAADPEAPSKSMTLSPDFSLATPLLVFKKAGALVSADDSDDTAWAGAALVLEREFCSEEEETTDGTADVLNGALERFGARPIELFMAHLSARRLRPLRAALIVETLGRVDSPRTEKFRTVVLGSFLRDMDARIRSGAVTALDMLGSSTARVLVERAASDEPNAVLRKRLQRIVDRSS